MKKRRNVKNRVRKRCFINGGLVAILDGKTYSVQTKNGIHKVREITMDEYKSAVRNVFGSFASDVDDVAKDS